MLNINHYINDNHFKMIYRNHCLNIVNYEKINYMESDKISLSVQDKTIKITGNHLTVKKLLDDEILIVGDFISIGFQD